MRIPCPYCGDRNVQEFTYRSDAVPVRPAAEGALAEFHDYVYLRENPAGDIAEHWYHNGGCRNWLIVHRHTVTHQIRSAALAQEAAR